LPGELDDSIIPFSVTLHTAPQQTPDCEKETEYEGSVVNGVEVEAPVIMSVNVVDSVMPAIPSTVIGYEPAGESAAVYIVSVLVRGSAPDAGLTV
jgi:hypothetical protein